MNRPKQGGAYVLQDDDTLETVTPPPQPPRLPHEEEAARDGALRTAEAGALPQATVTVDGRPIPGTAESTTADPPASRRRRAPEPEAPQQAQE